MIYKIKQGDTLEGIATANATDVMTLQKLNPQITDINKIFTGQDLNLPTLPMAQPLETQKNLPNASTPTGPVYIPPPVSPVPQPPTLQPNQPIQPAQPIQVPQPVQQQPQEMKTSKMNEEVITDPVTKKQFVKDKTGTYQPYTPQQAEESIKEKGIILEPTKIQTNPEGSWQTTYQDLFTNLGLDKVKTQIEENIKKINDLDNQMIEDIATINDNPWLSESLRSRKVSQTQEKYNQKKVALTSALALAQDTYNQGRQEAQFLVTTALRQYNEEKTFDLNQQKFLADQAESSIKAREDLLKIDPNRYQSAQGGIWDIKEGKWIVQPKGEQWSKPYQMGDSMVQTNLSTGEIRKAAGVPSRTGTELSTQQYGILNQLTTRFQADPIINQSIKGSTASVIADQIIANPKSATSQLKSLYILVKNLDPDSAVREGELALANQTQSYLQTFANSLTRITEGRVISPDAAVELAKATKELMGAWNSTAQKRQKQYDSQANTLGLGDEFKSYIQGSGLGYNQPQTQGQIITAPDGQQIEITD